MLMLGLALMLRHSLPLMDEPSIGLAPRVTADVFGSIARLRRRDDYKVEQNARMALAIADEGHVLETGRPVLSGLDRPGADPGIIETYLDSEVS